MNGIGDACEPPPSDTDGDGVDDAIDNCPNVANPGQQDADMNGTGDACEAAPSDTDSDGVDDAIDNCPNVANPGQEDIDHDGIGNACDAPQPMPADVIGQISRDKTGSSVAFAGDFNKDGYGDFVVGTPGYDITQMVGGKLRTITLDVGKAEVISGANGAVLASLKGSAKRAAAGTAVAGGKDIDGDGYSDVVVGAPSVGNGEVRVLYGPDGSRTQVISAPVSMYKSGFGFALALGDINGDGKADVIVGANVESHTGGRKKVSTASVTVFSGADFTQLAKVYSEVRGSKKGWGLAACDYDGDGDAELIVGAPDEASVVGGKKQSRAGSVTVYNADGTSLLKVFGAKSNMLGASVACGDINNDGKDDVIAGAPNASSGKMTNTGTVFVYAGSTGSQLASFSGSTKGEGVGKSVGAGDVNGDGFADIIVGSTGSYREGRITVYSGQGDHAQIGSTRSGPVKKELFGSAVSAGDINSDGKADLIIGTPAKLRVEGKKKYASAGRVTLLSGASL